MTKSDATPLQPIRGQVMPCGESHIPKAHKCSKGSGLLTAGNLKTAAKVALAVGAVAGGAYLAKHIRNKQRPMTMEEWRNSPESFRTKPQLTEAEAQRIADEAIAGGQVWDVQEKINARRLAEREAENGEVLD